jgi:serine/threonine-protein phosphatase 2B catalytic subunit
VDHPYHLPHNMDLFSFSIPYLAEQVSGMLYNLVAAKGLMTPPGGVEQFEFKKLVEPGDLTKEELKKERLEALRNKIKAVGRMSRIFKNLRYFHP